MLISPAIPKHTPKKLCISHYSGLDLSGNLMFVGEFSKGLPVGHCWLAKEGQGWLFGEVDKRGRFTGDNIAYIYPDLLTAITGTFHNEVKICTYVCTYVYCQLRKARGKSLIESWVTTFLPNWQLPLIFVRFISNFLCMCSNSVDSAHVILK